MATDPAMIQQVARAISVELGVAMTAEARVAFNGRWSTVFIHSPVAVGGDSVRANDLVAASP